VDLARVENEVGQWLVKREKNWSSEITNGKKQQLSKKACGHTNTLLRRPEKKGEEGGVRAKNGKPQPSVWQTELDITEQRSSLGKRANEPIHVSRPKGVVNQSQKQKKPAPGGKKPRNKGPHAGHGDFWNPKTSEASQQQKQHQKKKNTTTQTPAVKEEYSKVTGVLAQEEKLPIVPFCSARKKNSKKTFDPGSPQKKAAPRRQVNCIQEETVKRKHRFHRAYQLAPKEHWPDVAKRPVKARQRSLAQKTNRRLGDGSKRESNKKDKKKRPVWKSGEHTGAEKDVEPRKTKEAKRPPRVAKKKNKEQKVLTKRLNNPAQTDAHGSPTGHAINWKLRPRTRAEQKISN